MRKIIDPSDMSLSEDVVKFNAELRGDQKFKYRPMGNNGQPMINTNIADGNQNKLLGLQQNIVGADRNFEEAQPLERWDVQIHTYRDAAAGKVSFFSNLFGGEASKVQAGVIHDAKRFRIETRENKKYEIGVAVRLSVATTNFKSDFDLTLPNLAASAQLDKSDTRVTISVLGYAGPLGELLPSPSKFDVESCIKYLNSFRDIQKLVFGAEGLINVVPTVLSVEDNQ